MLAFTSAPISARPFTPDSGRTTSTVGAAPEVLIGVLARHTLMPSGGTVTFTVPSAAGLTAVSVPNTGVKTAPLPLVQVGKDAVAALVPLLAATTYSTRPASLPLPLPLPLPSPLPLLSPAALPGLPLVSEPMREIAKMPGPSVA